jgi:hypothetical protein
MDVATLLEFHPELYHMADPRNFANILRRGLLSTTALLDLFGINGEHRRAIESEHRARSIPIHHPRYGAAYIRDQRPMDVKGLNRSLPPQTTAARFFEFLNGRIFFWLTRDRLKTMNAALAYGALDQVVLTLDTASVTAAYHDTILLSPMNSGATKPMPHPRSIEMFKSISNFDWNMKRPRRNRVVELTVVGSMPDLVDHLVRVEVWRGGELSHALEPPYDSRNFEYGPRQPN